MIGVQRKTKWFVLVFLVAFLWFPGRAQAQEQSGISLTATAGFDGYWKDGYWTPVHISVANDGPSVEAEARIRVGSTGEEVLYSAPVSLPTQSDKQLTLYVYLPGAVTDLTVDLVDERERLLSRVEASSLVRVNPDTLLYGVVSDEPAALDFLDRVAGRRSNSRVAFLDETTLPDVGAGLNALDILVITNVDTGRFSAAQLAAIQAWVAAGGTLVVTGGVSGAQTTAALADLLPVTLNGSESVSDLPVLREHTASAFRDPGPYVVSNSSLRSGEALLQQDGMPLLARQEWGVGQVYFLALDPNVAPLLDWAGSEIVWEEIADSLRTAPIWARGVQTSYSAANAVTRLPSLNLPSWAVVGCFLGIYVLVVGPLNYLLLRRLRRRELAWLTIPAVVLFFSGLAYLTGILFADRHTTVAQLAIVYGHAGSSEGRANSIVGLYSPRRARYDMALPADTLIRPFERNFGSLTGGGNLDRVVRGTDVVLDNVRVDVGGVETFVADSYRPLPDISGQVLLQVNGSRTELEITLQNNGDVALVDAGLLIGRGYIRLGDIGPGELIETTERLSTGQASAVTSGARFSGPGGLSPYYDEIFDDPDFALDPEIYPRWQLLESFNTYQMLVMPAGSVTLLAWSEEPQLEIEVDRSDVEHLAATAYFLELPVTESVSEVEASAAGYELPAELYTWEVLSQRNVYQETITEFYLANGSIEIEFVPWPAFQEADVTGLKVLLATDSSAANTPPEVRLWDWSEETWVAISNPEFGTMSVTNFEPYIGPQNSVRIHLESSSSNGAYIRLIHPILLLSGDVAE